MLRDLSRHHLRILDALLTSESGLSFNRLADALRGSVSRSVISREIKRLVEEGLVEVERDLHHSQRLIYRISEKIRDLALEIAGASADPSDLREAAEVASEVVRRYGEVIASVGDRLIRIYLRHRALEEMRRILLSGERILGGSDRPPRLGT